MSKKIINVFIVLGTRPEAIKLAPLILELKRHDSFLATVCVTGQHTKMLFSALEIFDIEPDIDLNIMKPNQDLFDITSNILLGIRSHLIRSKPDLVIVHGDTSTAFSAALASFYLNIKVAHVEAGLRTYNISAPFPEEFNRQIVSKIATYHFSPTPKNKQNLILESVKEDSIFVTGNTVIDSLYIILNKINKNSELQKRLSEKLERLISADWKMNRIVLITGHRRENFGMGFNNICKAIKELSEDFPDICFVYPVHLNPNVQNPVSTILGGLKNVYLINPLDYITFVYLLHHSYLVLTDSGGIQEEAPSLGKPVLVMRNETERDEGVEAGCVKLVGSESSKIYDGVSLLFHDNEEYDKISKVKNPYGDGTASVQIVKNLKKLCYEE